MKRIAFYAFLMIIVIVILPLLIVKGCGFEPEMPSPSVQDGVKIKVYLHKEDKVVDMFLEEYLMGVVAAENPAEFGLEALKAQAVASRTYALRKAQSTSAKEHKGADVCTSTHCQAWVSKEDKMKEWGIFNARSYWSKIEKAVNSTQGIVITYNGTLANSVFHSNSGGKTENAEEVWKCDPVPYLKSVPSIGEEDSIHFRSSKLVKTEDFINTVKKRYPDFDYVEDDFYKDIEILNYTTGGRVETIRVGNIIIKGTDFRTMFELRSANFVIEKYDEGRLRITAFGNGHGVGMSQWGAHYMAKQGYSFHEIIKYYYKGIELKRISIAK